MDIVKEFEETYNRNHDNPCFKNVDLSEDIPETLSTQKNIDLLAGSPPCQGISVARGSRKEKNDAQVKRNRLTFDFIKIVENIQPKIVLMENVSGLGSFKIDGVHAIDYFINEFNKIGYNIIFELLNCCHFGVPQNRFRIIGLAIKKEFDIAPVIIKCDIHQKFEFELNFNTLRNAIGDLPLKPSKNGTSKYSKEFNECCEYQQYVRKNSKSNIIHNHELINFPNEKEMKFIKRIQQGQMYRSNRFGEQNIGVWELFKDDLQSDEAGLLHFVSKMRINEKYTEEKVGFIRLEKFPVNDNGKFLWKQSKGLNRSPKEIIESLINKKLLRFKEFSQNKQKYMAYDINTNSGLRQMYIRLPYNSPSRTILTTSFRVREFIHPVENRPLTLREGARIQSFPDDFIFYGRKALIPTMIANAVPPLLSLELGNYVKILLDYIENGDNEIKSFLDSLYESQSPLTRLPPDITELERETVLSRLKNTHRYKKLKEIPKKRPFNQKEFAEYLQLIGKNKNK